MFYTCGCEYNVLCITCTEKMGIKGNKTHLLGLGQFFILITEIGDFCFKYGFPGRKRFFALISCESG